VVNCLENVFADLSAQINAVCPEGKKEKPKRNAFVFITAEPNSSKSTLEDLKKVEGVNEVYLSHGAYDFVVKVSGESLDHLREIVFKQIKNLSSIRSTLTLMVV
jgi:DNA-binding Lrp family transcriptional regulator